MSIPIPEAVQKRIDALEEYDWNDSLSSFNSVHLYPSKLAYPDGYHDAYFFKAIGYNECMGTRRDLGQHDGLLIEPNIFVNRVIIYADKSTFIGFNGPIEILRNGQALIVQGFQPECPYCGSDNIGFHNNCYHCLECFGMWKQ